MSDPNTDPPAPTPDAEAVPRDRKPWWSKRAFWVLFSVTILTLAGVAGAWKVDRIEKDPRFCNSCHLAAVEEASKSTHSKQACTDCHANKFEENLRQWSYGLFSKTKTTPHGRLDKTSCKKCHTSGSTEPWQMGRSLGHVKHVLKTEEPIDCPKCHLWKEHGVEPDPDACGKCHDDIEIYGKHKLEGKDQKIPCVSCHNYLAKVGGGAQTPSHDCRRCHGGEGKSERSQRYAEVIDAKAIPTSQIHGNLRACSLCHSPHEKDPEKRKKGAECNRCHVKIPGEFHHSKQPEKFDCNSCHEAHGSREELRKGCRKCHTEQAKQTKTVSARHDRCSQCHKPHEFKATYAGCRDCHKDQTEMLAGWKSVTHAECTNCHKPHSTKEEDTTCAKCHKKPGHGHKSCTNCHDPHQAKTQTKNCADCHAGQSHALARAPAKHRAAACLTCHQPHSSASTPAACKRCHAKESGAVTTARIDKHTRCASCHQTHAFTADVAACRTCHDNPTTGVHTGKCTDCHQAHGPPIGQAAGCRNCHKDIPQPGGAHAKCNTCHKAAHGEVKAPLCNTCHSPQSTGIKAWAAKTHEKCTQCHTPHSPTNPKACPQCHASQDKLVRRTKHRCTSCHDAHQPPKQLWGACAKCHATQIAAVKSRGPKHSDCKSCHQQHDVTPPACGSCHKGLPRLHTAKGHEKCTECHDQHKRQTPARADCLKCHTNRANHYPEAQHCVGCHLFKNK